MEKIRDISAVIIAGGKNLRYGGKIKTLEIFDNQTILQRTSEILQGIFSEVIIITNQPEILKLHTSLPLFIDIITEKGPLGGIHSGLMNISNPCAFFVAGDMPLISKDIIIDMAHELRKTNSKIFVPQINGEIEPLHAFYSKSLISEIETQLSYDTDNSIKAIFKIVEPVFYNINPEHVGCFQNINSPGDLKKL